MVERERRYRRPRTQGGSSQTTGGPPQRPRKKPLQLRLAVCLLLLLLLLAVAAGRVAWIQVVQGGDMKEKAMGAVKAFLERKGYEIVDEAWQGPEGIGGIDLVAVKR